MYSSGATSDLNLGIATSPSQEGSKPACDPTSRWRKHSQREALSESDLDRPRNFGLADQSDIGGIQSGVRTAVTPRIGLHLSSATSPGALELVVGVGEAWIQTESDEHEGPLDR
jgi:hypothetical protein